MKLRFTLNGKPADADVDPGARLSAVLRSDFGHRQVREDCLKGLCGRCVVLLDGKPVNSCLVPAFRAEGRDIVTFEGFERSERFKDIQAGFRQAGFEPCPFCEGARYLVANVVIDADPRPSDDLITDWMSSISCRCTQPSTLLAGVKAAAAAVEHRTRSDA